MGSVLDKVVSFIGRPFGIYTHDETFTDLQVSNLLTPGEASRAGRKNSRYRAYGNAQQYFLNYRAFQRDYRRKYGKRFLENYGFAPNVSAVARVADEVKCKAYIENTYGYADVTVQVMSDRYLNTVEKGRHAAQQNVGYDLYSGETTIGGNTYTTYGYEEGVNESSVVVVYKRDYEENILENLTTNYMYNDVDNTISIGGETYLVGELSPITESGNYSTVCTHIPEGMDPMLPDEVVLTPVEFYRDTVTDARYGTEVLYVKYVVTSGEIPAIAMYLIEYAGVLDVYTNSSIDATAIIPMKEDNNISDLESRGMQRMLRRLNLSAEQLTDSIKNPDMDSAYLMTGIDPQQTGEPIDRVLYQTFDKLSPGNGNITVSISKLSLRYTFTMSRSVVSGVAAPVGKYARVNQTATSMTLRYQGNSSEYQEMQISAFGVSYTISGGSFTADFASTGGYCRIIIPLDVYNSLRYKDWEYVYERSLCMLAYATETVEVKWYETGAFGTLLKIVGFILVVVTLGTATSLYALIVAIAEMIIIGAVVSYIAREVGGFLAVVLAVVAAFVLGGGFEGLESLSSPEVWLKAAVTAISTMNQSIQHELDQVVAQGTADVNELTEKYESISEKLKELEDEDVTTAFIKEFDSAYAGKTNPIYKDIETYCSTILSTEVESLADYEGQIAYAIESRTNVISGIG